MEHKRNVFVSITGFFLYYTLIVLPVSAQTIPAVLPAQLLNPDGYSDLGADITPSIAYDGKRALIAVWSSNEQTLNSDFDIYYSKSSDNGRSWGPKQPIGSFSPGNDSFPTIATDGHGKWIVVWDSLNPLNGTIGSDLDILYSESTDNGATWSPPKALGSTAAIDSDFDRAPQIESDGLGNWIVVWMSKDSLNDTIGHDHDIVYVRSSNNGNSWTETKKLNSYASVDCAFEFDYRPKIATDKKGVWIAYWEYSLNPNNCGVGTIPQLEFGGHVAFARSIDNGRHWSEAELLDKSANIGTGEEAFYALAPGTNGTWVGIYSRQGGTPTPPNGTDADIFVVKSTDDGLTWSNPKALNTNALSDNGWDYVNSLSTDKAGRWIAAWDSNNGLNGAVGGDNDVHYAYSSDDGETWTDPQPLNDFAGVDNPSGGTTVDQEYDTNIINIAPGKWFGIWSSTYDLNDLAGPDSDIMRTQINANKLKASFPNKGLSLIPQ